MGKSFLNDILSAWNRESIPNLTKFKLKPVLWLIFITCYLFRDYFLIFKMLAQENSPLTFFCFVLFLRSNRESKLYFHRNLFFCSAFGFCDIGTPNRTLSWFLATQCLGSSAWSIICSIWNLEKIKVTWWDYWKGSGKRETGCWAYQLCIQYWRQIPKFSSVI